MNESKQYTRRWESFGKWNQVVIGNRGEAQEFVEEVGTFDTLTAIHLLEYLSEAQIPLAFQHLLQVTRHRLMVAVSYEAEATRAFGHQRVFTRETLEHCEQWCVESFDGVGRFWCEDMSGELLIIDCSTERVRCSLAHFGLTLDRMHRANGPCD